MTVGVKVAMLVGTDVTLGVEVRAGIGEAVYEATSVGVTLGSAWFASTIKSSKDRWFSGQFQ